MFVRWLEDLDNDDVAEVGGKNASLGEMIGSLQAAGVQVPAGFATTSDAYWQYVQANGLSDVVDEQMAALDDGTALHEVGHAIRVAFRHADVPAEVADAIRAAYRDLSARYDRESVDVAVRSSATAEDLPEASFAGQQETFLNILGEAELLDAVRRCFASLFTDRAITYRRQHGFDHTDVALSVGVQKMVASDRAGAGVMFTLDTESGFPDVVTIDAAWGLGESVVAGTVNPDSYVVFKPLLEDASLAPIVGKELGPKETRVVCASGGTATTRTEATPVDLRRQFVLTDDEILTLARWAVAIEQHYDRPMDIEWAKDADLGEVFIVQARPETVQSQKVDAGLRTCTLLGSGEVLAEGVAVGDGIAAGPAVRITDRHEMDRFEDGAVLVTDMTDPDWLPVMRRAAAVVTDLGGRTAHAAIVSRELGIPAVVGTGDATDRITDGDPVTVSCAEGGAGRVYAGILEWEEDELDTSDLPTTRTEIMMNVASPEAAFRWWQLPTDGIGLARMEFIINNHVETHPLALLRFDEVTDDRDRARIEQLTRGYEDRSDYFVARLSRGIARIAASQYPRPVIVRTSDFKTNEYANLVGGAAFEPVEANPMLGFRGASRYYSPTYRDGFALECRAIRRVREQIGLDNVVVMLPFVRTVEEADRVLEVMAAEGLERGREDLQVFMMCEIPSNVVLADQFAERFDGFSIGTNDLTQLVLGIDRDSDQLAELFDERDEAVTTMIRQLIERAHAHDTKVGLCGQAPSDHPDFARFLVEAGIDSISLNPDSVVPVLRVVAEAEAG